MSHFYDKQPYLETSEGAAQARIISDLNASIRDQRSKIEKLQKVEALYKPKAEMYDEIIAMVMEHPSLQSIWDDLITTMRLIEPEKFR